MITATHSNLERFLQKTTPIVPSRLVPKCLVSDSDEIWEAWESTETETVEFFTLADLWACYDEWSAYGVGVPIVLNKREQTLVQYYVPYLSAIQIFSTNTSVPTYRGLIMKINSREDYTNGDCETKDSLSDSFSDESGSEKSWKWEGGSSNDSSNDSDRVYNHNEKLGCLCFEYFENSNPYARIPLMDKINCLSSEFPGLMSLKSIDISPASWIAVAWYPIYHIPTGKSVKDLCACFLTFHTISSTFQENEGENGMGPLRRQAVKDIALSPFGLATYKMQGSVWEPKENGQDEENLVALENAADSWLKQLGVQHHDFDYFMSNRHR